MTRADLLAPGRAVQRRTILLLGIVGCLCSLPGAMIWIEPAAAQDSSQSQYSTLPTETPAKFTPVTDSFDYIRRDVMIPMRDGVKLHTVILVPKGAKDAPILLTRTPYNANELTSHDPRGGEQTAQLRAHIWARSCTATTTPPTSSSRAAISASCRTCAASMAPRATT